MSYTKCLDSKVSSNLIQSSRLNSALVSPNIQLSSSSLHCAALLCLGRTKLQPYLDGWNSAQYSKANTSANKTHTNVPPAGSDSVVSFTFKVFC